MEPIERIIKAFESGRNIFLTGGAGVGKSYNVKKFIEYCEENNIEVARAAMTGMASLQLPAGETVHSLFKLGTNTKKEQFVNVVTNFMFQKETQYLLKILDVIIIDEVSMLRSDLIELIDQVLKYTLENEKPFGGKQVILLGDFMQLPPVVKDDEPDSLKNSFWAFESPVWNDLNLEVVYLTEVKRQDDINFSMALNMIRAGIVNADVSNYFLKTQAHVFPEGVTPVKLLSTNREVENMNQAKLDSMKEIPEEVYTARIEAKNDFLRKKIIQDVVAMEILRLKVGCQVMLLRNQKGIYVNGSMGEYLGFERLRDENGAFIDCLKVRLFDNGLVVHVDRAEWTIEKTKNGVKDVEASFVQFPVKVGYAITIHKSQGMSIDFLEVNLAKCFADGMAYVALSRARKYEGLKVLNWNPRAVKCNQKAFNYYMGLKTSGVI